MPEVVDPNESESRQSLYRDLLSHLNTTLWGSPSTLDNLNPIKTIGETYSELTYRPSEEELKSNSIEFGPEGKALPKTIAGKLSRFTRKLALDTLYSGANALERAYRGEASIQDAAEAALTAISGGSFGSGGSTIANAGPGWQSRTLDWLVGRLGKAPKQATTESWIAKMKQAGLPEAERTEVEDTIRAIGYNPKDRIGANKLAFEMEHQGNLPDLGIETRILSNRYTDIHDAMVSKQNKLLKKMQDTTTPTAEWNRAGKAYDTIEDRLDFIRKKMSSESPRWSQFNLEEVTSPREILYKQRGSTYRNPDIETHYGDLGEGLQWHQREGKLQFPEGQSTHLSEQQSDLASEYAKQQKIGGNQEERQRIIRRIEQLRDPNSSMAQLSEDTRRTLINQLSSELMASHGNVPKPTLGENYYKTGFRDLVNRAVKEDSKFVSWDSAAVQKKRWPAGEGTDKFFDQHYDQKLVSFVKKEYGVTPEKIELGKPRVFLDRNNKPIPRELLMVEKGGITSDDGYRIVYKNPEATGAFSDAKYETFHSFSTKEQAEDFIRYKYETVDPKDSKQIWRIPITDDIKRKVLLEGQYFSKKPEDDFRRPYDIG